MFRYILVLNRHRFINMRALNPFRRHRRRRNRRPAPKRLEARIHDVALVIHLDLQLHHVPARRGANHARAHVQIALIKTTHISRVLVVINNLRGARPSTNVSQPAHPSITGARAHPSTWRARSHGRTFLSYARLVTAFHNVAAVAVAVAVVVVARDGSRARGAARSRSARRRPVDIGADDAIGNDASNRRCRVA